MRRRRKKQVVLQVYTHLDECASGFMKTLQNDSDISVAILDPGPKV